MEEHIFSYIKNENPNKLMKKVKKELHSVLPTENALLELEVLKKGTFLKKKLYLSVYTDHIIAFKEKGQKQPLSIIFLQFSLKIEWLSQQTKQKDGKKVNKLFGFKLYESDCEQTAEFHCANEANLLTLVPILNRKISVLGFHETYKALKKIGKGSFASVYLVVHKENAQQFAVKAFSKEALFAQENGKESLINELKIMRLLDHPNVLKLYEVCETENSLYMVMELLQGGSLIEKIREKTSFPIDDALPIMRGMLKAVEHAHSKGIMHRDLKPENILFKTANCKENDVVLADFGLSTLVNEKKYLFFRCGTPGYVAPEVINLKDENATYREVCDIFSLGVIFHIMLLGKPPFTGKNYNEVINENKACAIDFSQEKYETIPRKAKHLLVKMLERDPNKRISAAEALKHQFFNEEAGESLENYEEFSSPLGKKVQELQDLTNSKENEKKTKASSMNSVESPNNLVVNKQMKRNTADSTTLKHEENESFQTNFLVSREPAMNGNTKTVEFVTEDHLAASENGNNSENGVVHVKKFRKESLQVKIYKNPTIETVSPNLRKDLEDYKNRENSRDELKIISPMNIIRENEEEEEKKMDTAKE